MKSIIAKIQKYLIYFLIVLQYLLIATCYYYIWEVDDHAKSENVIIYGKLDTLRMNQDKLFNNQDTIKKLINDGK